MAFIKFAWKSVHTFVYWSLVAYVVFISNFVRRLVGAPDASTREQIWAAALVLLIFIVIVFDSYIRFRKIKGKDVK